MKEYSQQQKASNRPGGKEILGKTEQGELIMGDVSKDPQSKLKLEGTKLKALDNLK